MSSISLESPTMAGPYGLPTPSYTRRVTDALTQRDRELLDVYLTKLAEISKSISSKIEGIAIDLFIDVEEHTRNIVVTSRFDVDAATGLSLWQVIGTELDRWTQGDGGESAIEVLQLIDTNLTWRV